MRQQGCLRRQLLTVVALLLTGCNGDGGSAAPTSAQLVRVEHYNPETGTMEREVRARYPAPGRVVLQPYSGTDTAEPSRQECEFADGSSPYPAVTSRTGISLNFGSPTGQMMAALLGLPPGWTSCQEFFPERALLAERRISRPPDTDEELLVDEIFITRTADGVLSQSHASGLLERLYPPVSHYTEAVRYVRADGRNTGMIYGAEAWPEGGSYIDYSGNIIYDLFMDGLLGGLVETDDGVMVSPAVGFALRYGYDGQGRLDSLRIYDGWGTDGQWLTEDDVAASGGLTRLHYEGDLLAQVETGLDSVDAQPTDSYRNEQYRYANGLLQERRVLDAQGRLVQRWQYALH